MHSSPVHPSLFISYRRTQDAAVSRVVAALKVAGIHCFFDVEDIDELADFPERIRQGIDASHGALVWWSADYAESDHCLAEFRRAWQHARRHSSDLGRRVWVLNPERSAHHVFAGELNSQNFLAPPAPEKIGEWARGLKERLDALLPEGPFADERVALPLPALRNVPTPNARFTGRGATLLRIHTALFPAQIGTAATGPGVYLHGMGGLGKSEVAAKYSHDFAHAFPGGVFWLSFATFEPKVPLNEDEAKRAGYRALEEVFAREPDLRAKLLRDDEGKPLAPERAYEAMAGWLNDRSAGGDPQRYLWILDNVPHMSPQDVRNRVLGFWRAPTAAGRTLLTTRDARLYDGFAEEHLEELGEVDALHLLSRFRPVAEVERNAAAVLVAEVGRHTLALMLLGERVRRDGDYARTLETVRATGRLDRLEQIADRLRTDLGAAARSVIATFELSIAPLADDAKRLLALAAVCAPNEAIPRYLLRRAFGGDEAGDAFADAVGALLDASLLGERRGRDAVDIHPLVADVAARLINLDTQVANRGSELKRLAEAMLAVMTEERVSHPRGWPLMSAYEPHAATLLDHLAAASPWSEYVVHTAYLSRRLIRLYSAQGFPSRARELAEWVLMACFPVGEDGELEVLFERPEARILMPVLPQAYAEDRDYDVAEQLQRTYVRWLAQERAPDDTEFLVQSDNLANILRERGHQDDLDEAHRIYERTLQAWRKRGPGSRYTFTVLNNLALVEERRGKIERAVALLEEVLARLRGLDEMEVEALKTKVSLSNFLLQTDPKRAVTLLTEALVEADRLGYRDTHPLKLRILSPLGAAAHRDKDWLQACSTLRRAVPALATVKGDRDAETTSHAWALFDAALRSGDRLMANDARVRYLDWLTVVAEDELTPEQRRIRADVVRRSSS